LTDRIVSYLLSDPDSTSVVKPSSQGDTLRDPSFDMCLARWANWIIEAYENVDDAESDVDLRKYTIVTLFNSLGPCPKEPTENPEA
jgi:ribosomal biogenesis protein LAS1